MSSLRLLVVCAGTGVLLTGLPSAAFTLPDVDSEASQVLSPSVPAMALLEGAVRSARTRTWSGTQHVVSVRDGQPSFAVLAVRHTPGSGSAVRLMFSEQEALAPDALDTRLLGLLAGHYDLRVAGRSLCAGRPAVLVEARRPGQVGVGSVAGRFWLDADTGLVLRREVHDSRGSVIRSSAFVDLQVDGPVVASAVSAAALEPLHPTGQRLSDDALQAMEAQGWPVVHQLPSGLELFESRLHEREGVDVLQLSYSDGLSTLSLFVQEGELAKDPEGTPQSMGGGTVWVGKGFPERVVWSGDGRTWTLVSDAPAQVVSDALLVLPHRQARVVDDGVGSRVWRGMSRVGSWLNPFG